MSLPLIHQPPRQSDKTKKKIERTTKMTPAEHHSRVRAQVMRVGQTLRRGQVEVVRRVEWIARDLRRHFDRRGEEVVARAEQHAGMVRRIFEIAKGHVTDAATLHSNAVRDSGTGRSVDIAEARRAARLEMFTSLTDESEAIRTAADAIRTEHGTLVSEIAGRFGAVGRTGHDSGGAGATAGPSQEGAAASSPILEEGDRIVEQLLASRGRNIVKYQNFRCAERTPARAEEKQLAMESGARQRGASLSEPGEVELWTQAFLGIGDRVVDRAGTTSASDRSASEVETLDEQELVEQARRAAMAAIEGARIAAHEQLDRQRDRTIQSLRKAARKARKALRAQGLQAENGMLTLAPTFADAWRELARKIRDQVPDGRFLDARKLMPKLTALDRAAKDLERRQIGTAREQDKQSRDSARDAVRQYVKSFGDIVQGARESTDSALVSSRMDFATSELAFTGRMSEGTQDALRLAKEHAEEAVATMERTPGGVERHGSNFVQTQVRESYESQVSQFERFYERNRAALASDLDQGVFVQIRQAAEREISDRAQRLDDAMPERSALGWIASTVGGFVVAGPVGAAAGAAVYAGMTDADESAVVTEIGSLPKEGRPALEDRFNGTYGNLRSRIDDKLSDEEEAICLALLRATEQGDIEASELAIANERSVWGINTAARDAVLRGLSGSELAELRERNPTDATVERMTAGLDPTDVAMDEDYLDRVRAARLAGDVTTRFDRARRQGDDASVQAIGQLEQDARRAIAGDYYAQFVTQREVDGMLTDVYREHAAQQDVIAARDRGETLSTDDARARSRDISADDARSRFADWATRTIVDEIPIDEYGNTRTIRHELSSEASQAVRAVVRQDANAADGQARADRAWASVAHYQIVAGERGGMSENRQVAVTRALQNPALDASFEQWGEARRAFEAAQAARPRDPARIAEAQWHVSRAFEQYQEQRTTHERRMGVLAQRLDPRAGRRGGQQGSQASLQGRQAASQSVGRRVGALFATADSRYGEEYGRTLATRGRADLYAASMLASGGYGDGTNEELLDLNWQGRSRAQIEAADERYRTDPNVNRFDWVTGDYNASLQQRVLGELSGDAAMRMREHMLGEPVTEADHVQLALMRYQHQRVQGTGFIARITMQDTPELRQLDADRQALVDMLRSDPALRNVDPLIGADGMLTPQAYAAIDQRDRARAAERRHQMYLDATAEHPPPVQEMTDAQMRDRFSQGLPNDLTTLSFRLGLSAENYRAEIDRQEAIAMAGIQVLGMIVAVALMFIPGVNVVAAGILAALITGIATILVKEGMRGERYGWEEMAQDVGMTAVEAATAWAGGRMAMRAASAAKAAGAAARAAGAAEAQVARRMMQVSVRQALLRGAATQGFSGLANRAMDDATWRDGLAKGIQRSVLAGARGAIVGAVSEGISTRLGHGLQQRLTGENVQRVAGAAAEGAEAAATSATRAAGRPSIIRTALGEGVTNALGSTAGELAGAGFDRLTGQARTGGWDLLKHLGQTLGRELLTGMARGAVQARWARRYEDTRQRLVDRGGPVSDAERAQLERYARSAGRDHDDGPEGFLRFDSDVRQAHQRRADLLGGIPEGLRPHLRSLPNSALERVRGYVDQPMEGAPRLALLGDLRAHGIDDLPSFARHLDAAAEQVSQRRAAEAAEARTVRRAVLAELPPHLRSMVADLPSRQLSALPPTALRSVAEAVARGEPLAMRDRAELVRQARAARPDVDAKALLAEVDSAIARGRAAHDEFREARRTFIEGLPVEARRSMAALPPDAMQHILRMSESGDAGTPHQRDALVRALRSASPDSDAAAMLRGLDAAVERTRAVREEARLTRLADRADALDDLPRDLRGPLSALPEQGVAIVRQLQQEGRQPSPHVMVELARMARADAPELDPARLRRAIADAIEHPRRVAAADAQVQRSLRRELLAGVPAAQRGRIADVPILRVSAAELAAHVGVSGADAAVVTVAGRPVVLLREGADPRVLHEQATRLLVARDPDWSSPAKLLDESRLRGWSEMPLTEQLTTWRAKLTLEIEAHRRLLAGYQAEAVAAGSEAARAELSTRADGARRALVELSRRLAEVDAIGPARRFAIAIGVASPPDFVAGPPRRVTAGVPDALASTARPAIEAPRTLAQRLRQIEAEAARSLRVTGRRVEQGVDAHGNLLVEADGSPRGYVIRFGYDVQVFGDGVTQIRIPVYLEPGKSVSAADLAKVRRNAQLGVDRYYAGRHHIPGPDGRPTLLRVELDFVGDPSAARMHVKVKAGDGPAFQNQWYVGGDPTTHAHEISHQLGLVDEYVDHGPHGFKAVSRQTAASAGVFHDQGLMGNYWVPGAPVPTVDPRTHVPRRYIERIHRDIQAARASALGPAPARPPPGPDEHAARAADADTTRMAAMPQPERTAPDAESLRALGRGLGLDESAAIDIAKRLTSSPEAALDAGAALERLASDPIARNVSARLLSDPDADPASVLRDLATVARDPDAMRRIAAVPDLAESQRLLTAEAAGRPRPATTAVAYEHYAIEGATFSRPSRDPGLQGNLLDVVAARFGEVKDGRRRIRDAYHPQVMVGDRRSSQFPVHPGHYWALDPYDPTLIRLIAEPGAQPALMLVRHGDKMYVVERGNYPMEPPGHVYDVSQAPTDRASPQGASLVVRTQAKVPEHLQFALHTWEDGTTRRHAVVARSVSGMEQTVRAVLAEGLPANVPAGHMYRYQRGEWELVPHSGNPRTHVLTEDNTIEAGTGGGTSRSWTAARARLADWTRSSPPPPLSAFDAEIPRATHPDDVLTLQRYRGVVAVLASHLTPEQQAAMLAGLFDAHTRATLGQVEGGSPRRLTSSQYDKFRHALREAMIRHLRDDTTAAARPARADALMRAMAEVDPSAAKGNFFTRIRQLLYEGEWTPQTNIQLQHMPPEGTRLSSQQTTRTFDGVMSRQDGEQTRLAVFEDKAGRDAFDPAQALDYAHLYGAGGVPLRYRDGTTDGHADRVIYTFDNEAAALTAANKMLVLGPPPGVDADYVRFRELFAQGKIQFTYVAEATSARPGAITPVSAMITARELRDRRAELRAAVKEDGG